MTCHGGGNEIRPAISKRSTYRIRKKTRGPDTMLSELEDNGFNRYDQDFIFHMRLLCDYELIVRVDGKPGSVIYCPKR